MTAESLPPIAIKASGLEVRYGDKIAVSGVDLEVEKGSLLSVIGPNGAGKSALLSALAGTVEVAAGEVMVEGGAPALVLQSTHVHPSLQITVRDAVALARYPHRGIFRRMQANDREAVDESIERMKITHLASNQFHQISGGERQRVLVAQGLAQESSVLLLDEPISGLDIVSQALILEAISEELDRGKTLVVTTHDLEDARRSSQVLLLCTEPCCVGTPDFVLTDAHLKMAFGGHHLRISQNLTLDDPDHVHRPVSSPN